MDSGVNENLNGNQFFHGTKHTIEGDTLKPSSWTGKENYDYEAPMFSDGELRKNSVFVAADERTAWNWAAGPGRERVHTVLPSGPLTEDKASGGPSFMTPTAKITGTIDIAPPVTKLNRRTGVHVRVPIQGTLPPQNWKEYGGSNHPTIDEVHSAKVQRNLFEERLQMAETQESVESRLCRVLQPRLFQ
jgi:hypothetical protein